MKNDKFCNNPLKPHCSAPCIEPHHQFIPLWGAEGITDATGATCSPHSNQDFLSGFPLINNLVNENHLFIFYMFPSLSIFSSTVFNHTAFWPTSKYTQTQDKILMYQYSPEKLHETLLFSQKSLVKDSRNQAEWGSCVSHLSDAAGMLYRSDWPQVSRPSQAPLAIIYGTIMML